ncbi:MAG: FAD-dependent oxidoreductase [Candidatus Sigynarchaeum springense]
MNDRIETDIVISGGGLAGCLAAIAAKRVNPKASVYLIERYGFLGGMATAGFVFPYMRYSTMVSGKAKRLCGGLFKELNDRMVEAGYMHDARSEFPTRFDPAMLRCILDEMVLEAGVSLLFHGLVNRVVTSDAPGGIKRVESADVQTKAGTIKASARYFIDATGDADIVFHAGGEVQVGRESDGLVQPATLNFRMGHLGIMRPARIQIAMKIRQEKSRGNPLTPRDDCLAFDAGNGRLHFNQTRVAGFDFTDPAAMTAAEIEGRKQARRFIDFLRGKVPGFKHAVVEGLGTQLGVRETRRIVGEHVLTEHELRGCEQFPDRIALGNYPVDIHDPKGSASTDIRRIPAGKWYSIPYRCLVPRGISNVLVAGRPVSATHVAHSAIRVMPICAVIGHAAGVAVGLASKHDANIALKDVPIGEIQDILRQQGAVLE